MKHLFALLAALALMLAGCSLPGAATSDAESGGDTKTITDVLGRELTVPAHPQRILLGGQRELYTTAILNPENPMDKVAAWPDDLLENDPDTYHAYVEKFPALADLPVTGELWDNSFSLEQALQTRPEVFVISASSYEAAQEAGIVEGFEDAGVPTVVIDYFVDPVAHTAPSVRIMGQLFEQEDRAERFVTYYDQKIAHVRDALAAAHPEPTSMFLWRAPGYFDCCQTFRDSNLAKLVTLAGGDNVGDHLLEGEQGTLSPEAVAKADPDVIIATGANWSPDASSVKPGTYVPLGYELSRADAAAAWQGVINQQPVISELRAVKDKRAFVAWHHFYDSPYNFLAVEWFAQALHPELFADLDPQADYVELHERFLPVEARGTFWAGLPE